MPNNLEARLIAVTELHEALPQETTGWPGVYELLYGAAVSLAACKRSILSRLDREAEYVRVRSELYDSFKNMIAQGKVEWDSEPFVLWSSGFFLNKAQAGVSSAVDRTLNLLIGRHFFRAESYHQIAGLMISTDKPQLPHPLEEFAHTHYTSRAKLLQSHLESGDVFDQCSELVQGADLWHKKYGDAIGAVTINSDICSSIRELEVIADEVSKHVTSGSAFAFTIGRFNQWKHQPSGTIGRMGYSEKNGISISAGRVSLVEWCLTIQALELAVKCFWSGLRKEKGL